MINLLQGAKSIFLYLIWRVGGSFLSKKFQILEKRFSFVLFRLIFLCCLCYYCTINVKRQSKLSGLCPDTSSLVVLTFDTKLTEYLCSGWVFFLQTNFDFLTSHF